jgi:FMN-dependent NADH-azoreductase
MKLLHIDSGIQGEQSASRAISAAIVAQLAQDDPSIEVMHRDLVAAPIGHLLPGDLAGEETQAVLGEFLAADIVVIGTGLYNFAIPTQLKAWIDRILIPGQTFRYGANGPEGLAGAKHVFIALARGGVYAPGSPMAALEHAEAYLRTIFGFIGVAPRFIVAEGLALGEESRAAAIAGALDRAHSVTTLAA